LQDQLGLGILFITHDLGVVRHLAHDVAVMYLGELVERAPADRLFAEPSHPYSRLLLSAVPRVGHRPAAQADGGEVPSPLAPPPGCRFHPRCVEGVERCAREVPEEIDVAEGIVRCLLRG